MQNEENVKEEKLELLLKFTDKGIPDIEGGGGGGGGGVADIKDSRVLFDHKVIHQNARRGDRLCPDPCGCFFEMFGFDFRNQALKGPNESIFVVGPPHFPPSHFPVLHRHFLETRIKDGFH